MPSLIGQMKALVRGGSTVTNEDAMQSTIPAGTAREVATGFQLILYGLYTVNGAMVVDGLMVVDALPT